ncbi:NUDIX domain-containing protein [Kitasatospora sp. NPDC056076]|uniref:NUDIX domain-containing protein n=1 Tax=Kitasatospora sp. NPDC056076 TaxID=3345703 RepID=UPI0035DB9103
MSIRTTPPGRRSGQQIFVLRKDPDGSEDFQVLLVDPEYRDGLTLPGGHAEANELPHYAARRHLETETGLVLELRVVLTVDYVNAAEVPEGLNLVWAGGVIRPGQMGAVLAHELPRGIRSLRWAARSRLHALMEPDQKRRVEDAWDAWESGAGRPMLLRGVPIPVS